MVYPAIQYKKIAPPKHIINIHPPLKSPDPPDPDTSHVYFVAVHAYLVFILTL